MKEQEAKELQETLGFRGYYKSRCGSSTNDYSMFLVVRDEQEKDDEGDNILLYQIEYRFWDYTKYHHSQGDYDDFGVDICILTEGKGRLDCELSYPRNVEDVEKFARKFYEFVKENEI